MPLISLEYIHSSFFLVYSDPIIQNLRLLFQNSFISYILLLSLLNIQVISEEIVWNLLLVRMQRDAVDFENKTFIKVNKITNEFVLGIKGSNNLLRCIRYIAYD